MWKIYYFVHTTKFYIPREDLSLTLEMSILAFLTSRRQWTGPFIYIFLWKPFPVKFQFTTDHRPEMGNINYVFFTLSHKGGVATSKLEVSKSDIVPYKG